MRARRDPEPMAGSSSRGRSGARRLGNTRERGAALGADQRRDPSGHRTRARAMTRRRLESRRRSARCRSRQSPRRHSSVKTSLPRQFRRGTTDGRDKRRTSSNHRPPRLAGRNARDSGGRVAAAWDISRTPFKREIVPLGTVSTRYDIRTRHGARQFKQSAVAASPGRNIRDAGGRTATSRDTSRDAIKREIVPLETVSGQFRHPGDTRPTAPSRKRLRPAECEMEAI